MTETTIDKRNDTEREIQLNPCYTPRERKYNVIFKILIKGARNEAYKPADTNLLIQTC